MYPERTRCHWRRRIVDATRRNVGEGDSMHDYDGAM
jgi:hypothetical protein